MIRFARAACVLALVCACGGEVAIGTLAPSSSGSPPPSGSSGSTGTPSTPPTCGDVRDVQALYDLNATGDDHVADFVGDGYNAWVGINYIGNFRAGRITRLPENERPTLVDLSPYNVERVARGLDRIFYASRTGTEAGQVGTVLLDGSADEKQPETPGPSLVAAHPSRADAIFTQKVGTPIHDEIRLWKPPTPPTTLLALSTAEVVQSLSMSATSQLAVVQNTTALVPTFELRRLLVPSGADAIATVQAETISNVIADGDSALLAVFDEPALKHVVYRFTGTGQSLATAERVAEVEGERGSRAFIEADATDLYVARTKEPKCDGPGCYRINDVFRLKKVGPAASNPAVKVKTFQGEDPFGMKASDPRRRGFNIDACWFYWHDTATRGFYRQAKAVL
jgi:hypothetical protein